MTSVVARWRGIAMSNKPVLEQAEPDPLRASSDQPFSWTVESLRK